MWHFREFEPGLLQREFDISTTMPLVTGNGRILDLIYFHNQIQNCNHIYSLCGARADTNTQAASHKSWLPRLAVGNLYDINYEG